MDAGSRLYLIDVETALRIFRAIAVSPSASQVKRLHASQQAERLKHKLDQAKAELGRQLTTHS